MVARLRSIRDGGAETTLQGEGHEWAVQESGGGPVPSYLAALLSRVQRDHLHDAAAQPQSTADHGLAAESTSHAESNSVAKGF